MSSKWFTDRGDFLYDPSVCRGASRPFVSRLKEGPLSGVKRMGSFGETREIDPLGSEVEGLLTETEPSVTPQQLLEIVTEALEKNLPGDLKGKARQNVLTFLIENEYRHSLKPHVGRAVHLRLAGRWNEHEAYDNSDRVDTLIERYKAIVGHGDEVADVRDIDQVVGPGGVTRLHVAAMDGEYAECKRLIEVEGANPDVIDNNKMNPYKRARAYGHHLVAEYLYTKMEKTKK